MFQELLSTFSTFSILIAAVLGVIRFRVIEKSYYPLIYICWLAFITEVVANFMQAKKGTLLPSNLYVLFEALLFTWQFRLWGSFRGRSWLFYLIQAATISVWVVDNLIWHNIHELSSVYRICYSVLLVILAIDHINKLIVHERKSFVTNAKFLLCIGVIFFFSYKFTLETFYLYALEKNQSFEFVISIFAIQKYVNLFANLLYAYIVLWIPRKKIFLQPFK